MGTALPMLWDNIHLTIFHCSFRDELDEKSVQSNSPTETVVSSSTSLSGTHGLTLLLYPGQREATPANVLASATLL